MQEVDEPSPADTGRAPLMGLGGWLVLPMLHLVVNTGLYLLDAVAAFEQSWNAAATARVIGPAIWSPVAHYTFVFAVFALLTMAYTIFCLVQLLQQRKAVPSLMILFYVLLIGMTGIHYMEIRRIAELTGPPMNDRDVMMFTVRVLVLSAVWIPYFLVSERVKNTFVR